MNFDKKIKKMLGIKSKNKSLNNLFDNKQNNWNFDNILNKKQNNGFNNVFKQKRVLKNNCNFDSVFKQKRVLRQDTIRYNYPHWLINQLNKEQQLEAEKMLLEEGYDAGQVAKHFGVDNPYIGVYKKSRIYFTNEQLINALQQIGRDKGRVPVGNDLKEYDNYPRCSSFIRHFGTWNNALREAGFISFEDKKIKKVKSKEELIQVLQQFAQEIGRTPTAEDINNRKDLPISNLYERYFGSWNNALKEAGLEIIQRKDYTKEELIQALQQFAQEIGRTPMEKDIYNKRYLPSYMTYINYFGSWNNALREAGLTLIRRYDYTKEELIQILQQFAQEIGRTPMIEDINKRSDLPSHSTYKKYFSTWNNALREAGLK